MDTDSIAVIASGKNQIEQINADSIAIGIAIGIAIAIAFDGGLDAGSKQNLNHRIALIMSP